jgi:glutathione synthase/RimK-type ligase-like ATP-grasp enzyme
MPLIALLTDSRYTAPRAAEGDWYLANILREDELLTAALGELGFRTERIDWAQGDVDWSRYAAAVFRTTWDYFDRFDEFQSWLNTVESNVRLLNPADLVRWNWNKRYLLDLEAHGIPIVPSRVIPAGSPVPLQDLLRESGWSNAVVKPCIAGTARHTYRVNQSNAVEVDKTIQPLRMVESFLLQPFQTEIVHHGEDSLMVFGGRYSHAVRKKAKPGDFRVQDDHGGTLHAVDPSSDQIALAERAVAACPVTPAYGRVDMVRDNDGRWAIMELELIEPELWLRRHPPAAVDLTRAIAAQLNHCPTTRR